MKVGIAGLGAMGTEMARRVEASEHELAVWNRSPAAAAEFEARGVPVAGSPRELLERVDACVTALSDGAAVLAVGEQFRGVPASASPRVWIEMSTIDPKSSARAAEIAAETGLEYLRAPVSGNPKVVAAGNLTIVSSGPASALERVRPVLAAIGPKLFHLGEGEEARVMKLALNLMIAASNQMLAEALTLGEAEGLDRARMLEVMSASAVGSPFVAYKAEPLIEDDYRATFSLALLTKDLDLILETAESAGVPLPATAVNRGFAQAAVAAGLGELDMSAIMPLLRREAGLGDLPPEPPR